MCAAPILKRLSLNTSRIHLTLRAQDASLPGSFGERGTEGDKTPAARDQHRIGSLLKPLRLSSRSSHRRRPPQEFLTPQIRRGCAQSVPGNDVLQVLVPQSDSGLSSNGASRDRALCRDGALGVHRGSLSQSCPGISQPPGALSSQHLLSKVRPNSLPRQHSTG